MHEITVLPADTYLVVNKTILNDKDRKMLIMLYQPIIGQQAVSLYFTLWSYLDQNELLSCAWTHHHLMTNMQLSLNQIIQAREKLEAIGLLKTYLKKGDINSYIYEIYSPISAYDFFNNPILSTTLYNNIGKIEYDKTMSYFKIPRLNLREYEDITCQLSDIFYTSNTNITDNRFEDIRRVYHGEIKILPKINLDNILLLIPEEMLNKKALTKETKELLYKLAFIYDFDEDTLGQIIQNSINEAHRLDKNLLRQNARKYYRFENSGKLPSLIYQKQPEYLRKPTGDTSKRAKIIYTFETTSPYDFLSSKYKNARPTKSDLLILEYLLIEVNLNPGVVNVLVDYVLKINDNKLIKNFIEVIASQWKKSNIETVEDAMKLAEKEYKQSKKHQVKKQEKTKIEAKPIWFDQKIEATEATEEEQAELEKLLNEFK